MLARKTLRPGEVDADQLGTSPEAQIGAAIVKEARIQIAKAPDGTRPLWIAVGALAIGFVMHLVSDGTLRGEVKRTQEIVEWLAGCELARQHGTAPPPFPLGMGQE